MVDGLGKMLAIEPLKLCRMIVWQIFKFGNSQVKRLVYLFVEFRIF